MTRTVAGVGVLLADVPTSDILSSSLRRISNNQQHHERKPLSEEEFLNCFRQNVGDVISNAYKTEPQIHQSPNGEITTTLCEDVFSLVHLQVEALQEYLSATEINRTLKGTVLLLEGLRAIVDTLLTEQLAHRDSFLDDLESCCAASNDFLRMLQRTEEFVAEIQEEHAELRWDSSFDEDEEENVPLVVQFHRDVSNLITAYGNDAVYAVQYAHVFVLRSIRDSDIPKQLFSRDWEDVYTHNQVALSLVKTMEDFLYDFHNYLVDDMLIRKVVGVLIQAIVCFYVRCFIRKAERLRAKMKRSGLSKLFPRNHKKEEKSFSSGERALCRMMYDIDVFRTYFEKLVKQTPSLGKVVNDELSTLVVIAECFALAITDPSLSQVDDLVLVLHKRTGANALITRFLILDIWMLGAPLERQFVLDHKLQRMHAELQLLSIRMKWVPQPCKTKPALKGILLDETLKDVYEERMLQAQVPCGSLVHSIKHSVKNQVVDRIRPTNAKQLPKRRTSRSPPVPLEKVMSFPKSSSCRNFSPYTDKHHDDFLENFQRTFVEILQMHNLTFRRNNNHEKRYGSTDEDDSLEESSREFVNPLK